MATKKAVAKKVTRKPAVKKTAPKKSTHTVAFRRGIGKAPLPLKTKKQLGELIVNKTDSISPDLSNVRLVMKEQRTGKNITVALGDEIAPIIRRVITGELALAKESASPTVKSESTVNTTDTQLARAEGGTTLARLERFHAQLGTSEVNLRSLCHALNRLTGSQEKVEFDSINVDPNSLGWSFSILLERMQSLNEVTEKALSVLHENL